MALSCLNYSVVCFLLSKHYAFEVVGRFGCLSDPKGYVLGRFQVKGKTPGRPYQGGGGVGVVRQFTYTIGTGKTTKTNLQNRPK